MAYSEFVCERLKVFKLVVLKTVAVNIKLTLYLCNYLDFSKFAAKELL